MRNWITTILISCLIGLAPISFAAPSITLQGRILKPDDTPLSGSNSEFRVVILSPGVESCILYDETQTHDLTNSEGLFTISLNDGTGTRNDGSAHSFIEALSNRAPLTLNGALCSAGSGTVIYTPSQNDERKVIIQFKDETMGSWESIPAMQLTHTPYALEARQVGGFPAAAMCRVEDPGTGPQAVSALTPANFTELLALVNGTSTQYTARSSTGASLPSFSGAPSSPSAGNVWFDSSTNNIQFYDGSSVRTLGTSGGSVNSITAGAGLTGGTITVSGTIALDNSGVTAGTYRSMTVDSYGRVTNGSNPTTVAGYGITDAVTSVGANTPLSSTGGTTPTISIVSANGSRDGYLTQTDWSTFNNKLGTSLASGTIWVGNGSGEATAVAPSGDVTMDNAGEYTLTKIRGKSVSATAPSADGQILRYVNATSTWTPDFLTFGDVSGTLAVSAGGTGTTNGSITGTGALNFTAGGTNQDITLTPSGTGTTRTTSGLEVTGVATARHFAGSTATPTIASGSGAGTSPTISIAGTDSAGLITITTGTTPSSSAVVVAVTFQTAYDSNPYCILTPNNANTASISSSAQVYVTTTTTTLTISSNTLGLSGSTSYKWMYMCMQ